MAAEPIMAVSKPATGRQRATPWVAGSGLLLLYPLPFRVSLRQAQDTARDSAPRRKLGRPWGLSVPRPPGHRTAF